MLYADLIDVATEVFGGYTPAMPPAALPPGASPLCQDVIFPEGSVRTRPGKGTGIITGIPGNPSVNYIKVFSDLLGNERLLYLGSNGSFWQDFPQGVETLILGTLVANMHNRSQTLFGREYIAFSDGQFGLDLPRQFDSVNFDRVSQVGPGQAPMAANGGSTTITISSISQPVPIALGVSNLTFNTSYFFAVAQPSAPFLPGELVTVAGVANAAYDIVGGPMLVDNTTGFDLLLIPFQPPSAGGTVQSQLVTVVTTVPHGLIPGDSITLAATGIGSYDGAQTVFSVIDQFTFTFNAATAGNGSGVVGTITAPGHISAGRHGLSVMFVTRQGFITAPAPPTSWVAAGANTVIVSGIPIGPPNIIARILCFSPTGYTIPGSENFFYFPNNSLFGLDSMVINDNITTMVQVDFSDAALAAGNNVTQLFLQAELGECSGVIGYNNRLFWWGERNKVQNFTNLTFNGGYDPIGDINLPLGWKATVGFSAINYKLTTSAVWQTALALIGDGVTPTPAMLVQSAYRDFLDVPILFPNTAYSVRIRVQLDPINTPTQGTANVTISSSQLAFTNTFSIPLAMLTTSYKEFTNNILPVGLANIPSDLQIGVSISGTPNNQGTWNFACMEWFPTNQPNLTSQVRCSYVNQPEAYDGVTGSIQIRTGDGTAIRGAFPLRNNLYFGKDNYLCYVTDDGKNEPSFWSVNEISSTIGICGPDAVDFTEEWGVFVHAASQGIYITFGSDPIKINQEVAEDASNTGKLTFSSVNWAYAYTIWVRIDADNKRILVGLPVNGATSPNAVFHMDYKFSSTAEGVTAGPGVVFSSFSGKLISHGGARKWSPWMIAAPSCGIVPRIDGINHVYFGGVGNGKIYDLLDQGFYTQDDGTAINSFYQGTGVPSTMEEQMLQLKSHNKLCGGVTGRVSGVGTIAANVVTMTQALGVVSVVTNVAHNLTTGNYVFVNAAGDPTFNGIYAVTVTSPNSFTYRAYTNTPSTNGASIQNTFSLAVINQFRTTQLRGGILSLSGNNFERVCNIHGDRFYFQVGTNAIGSWFQLERLCPMMKIDPTMPFRGALS